VIASLVPTARFAQPIGTLVSIRCSACRACSCRSRRHAADAAAVARVLPLTYAVSLLRGIWHAEGWSAHAGDVIVLVLTFVVCTALSSRVFRWE
jgi:ABC-2 type transport system permease protein